MVKPTILKQFPIFEMLSEEEEAKLIDLAEYRKVPKYTYIYNGQDPSESIFFLVRGTVKIGAYSNDGREAIKDIKHPLAIFGELCIVGETHRQDFAMTMNDGAHLYELKVEHFKMLMHSNMKLREEILLMIGRRLQRTESRLEALIFKDARARIINFLKETARNRGRQVGFEHFFKHALTQQDIANITDTSRQTVTLVLNDLRKSNLIYFNRNSFLIRDIEKLV